MGRGGGESFSFSLIICTYQRPQALLKLLNSVKTQEKYPDQVLIIDGSLDDETRNMLSANTFLNLEYYKVDAENRGLTKQRNYGIDRVNAAAEIVCFLDDDIVLTENYFSELLKTYKIFPDAVGVGGYILNESNWKKKTEEVKPGEFEFDGWGRNLGSRYIIRKKIGLLSADAPGKMPKSSNGLPVAFLPPSGKTYPVDFFMGGVSSFKKSLFQEISFSTYFEGYGLYEDMDFCLRASEIGQLYVNTAAQLYHYHDEGGRPNKYKYGKMVIRNGWYVWRVKYPQPSFSDRLKWNATVLLLTLVRMGNVLTTKERKEALTESLGRIAGWCSLLFKKPGK